MADDSDATVSSSHLKDGGPSSDIEDEEDRAPPRKQVDALGNSMNEQSPLLSPRSSGDEESFLQDGRSRDALELRDLEAEQETKSIWYLFMLTLSIGGLQIAWATELSNGSPFLLSLGMSKAVLAFVWIAGPLSGVLVQPYIGILSDNSRISWGKRRPFMLAGALATAVSLIALAWTREIVGGIFGAFGADLGSTGVKNTGIVYAIIWVYILDFSINTVQAAIRAFIVDNAPVHQQEDANAWAGRITGFGNILGYLSGYVDLPRIMPFFGNTQFKVLCVIAALALSGTVIASSVAIQERDPRREGPVHDSGAGIMSFCHQTVHAMLRLPPQIRKVCEVQFFNWMGWFPFLFYFTTWAGQIYLNPYFEEHPDLSPEEIDEAWERATRVGTFALLIFAITSFASSIILPFIIVPSYRPITKEDPLLSSVISTSGSHSASLPQKKHSRLAHLLSTFQVPGLTLRRAWLLSHILFAICMASTFIITTTTGAAIMAGFVGVSWSLTLWSPFALISADISKRGVLKRSRPSLHIRDNETEGSRRDDEKVEDQAGVILGIHNVSVSAPQILATLVSSVIFKIAQRDRGQAGDTSVGWVLRFGGVAALVAAFMTKRVEKEHGDEMSK